MPTTGSAVLSTVVCAAPPARKIDSFIRQAQTAGWSVRVVLTPHAADWLDSDALARLTGNRLRAA
jgi:hypothetical protein